MFEFEKILKGLKEFAESEVPLDLLFISANEVKADFQNRVFNSEDGSKDRTGKGLGKYSKKKLPLFFYKKSDLYDKIDELKYEDGLSYSTFRELSGRQNKVKDLELTSSLRRSIRTARTDEEVNILISSSVEIEKAKNIESQSGKDIFSFSDSEIESFQYKSDKLFNNEIKEIIKNAQNNT